MARHPTLNQLRSFVLAACFLLAPAAVAFAQEKPTAFTGAHIIPIVGQPIDNGTLLVQGGKIIAVGASDAVRIPDGVQSIDAKGKTIMPGLVDTHSHIGGIGGADQSGPIQPDVRIYDSINVRDSGFMRARAGGLTTLNIMPGSGHLLSGQTIYVKIRNAEKIDDMFILDAAGQPSGGIKMANGTNPQGEPPFPGTRGKSAALMRQQFIKAQEYRDKVTRAGGWGGDPDKLPPRDIGLDALVEVLDGKRIVHHHTHRADDIMTVIRLAQEFRFRVVLHHVSEAWKVADEIAAAKIPCSMIIVDSPGGKLEAAELTFDTAPILEKAGVLVAFHTDDWITDSRLWFRMAAFGVRAGMTRQGALEALTINPAKMLDLDKRIGSLEAGKDADFIILSGDPLSLYTHVEQTWIEGAKVFDRSVESDRLYATGGFGAAHDQEPYFCCFDHDHAVQAGGN